MPSQAWCTGLHTTPANESDVAHTDKPLHRQETKAHADSGYTGVEKLTEIVQAQAEGKIRADIEWNVATRRGKIKKMTEGPLKELVQAVEHKKAQIRARVEHPSHIVKNLFLHRKVRYKGLAKNTAQLYSLFALANLVIAKTRSLKPSGQGVTTP